MKRKQYSVEQIVTALKHAELGTTVTVPARGGLAQFRPLLLDESFGRTFQDVARDAHFARPSSIHSYRRRSKTWASLRRYA